MSYCTSTQLYTAPTMSADAWTYVGGGELIAWHGKTRRRPCWKTTCLDVSATKRGGLYTIANTHSHVHATICLFDHLPVGTRLDWSTDSWTVLVGRDGMTSNIRGEAIWPTFLPSWAVNASARQKWVKSKSANEIGFLLKIKEMIKHYNIIRRY